MATGKQRSIFFSGCREVNFENNVAMLVHNNAEAFSRSQKKEDGMR